MALLLWKATEPDRTWFTGKKHSKNRSVNMAYVLRVQNTIARPPTEIIFYDIGRLVSLWVSAFEILAHPGGPKGRVDCDRVFDLIEKTRWELPEMAERIYATRGKTEVVDRPLASWLYRALYDCRNNFLHGNPVEPDGLRLPDSTRTVIEVAAPLYRLALTAFLPLTFDRDMPADSDTEALETYLDYLDYLDPPRRPQ